MARQQINGSPLVNGNETTNTQTNQMAGNSVNVNTGGVSSGNNPSDKDSQNASNGQGFGGLTGGTTKPETKPEPKPEPEIPTKPTQPTVDDKIKEQIKDNLEAIEDLKNKFEGLEVSFTIENENGQKTVVKSKKDGGSTVTFESNDKSIDVSIDEKTGDINFELSDELRQEIKNSTDKNIAQDKEIDKIKNNDKEQNKTIDDLKNKDKEQDGRLDGHDKDIQAGKDKDKAQDKEIEAGKNKDKVQDGRLDGHDKDIQAGKDHDKVQDGRLDGHDKDIQAGKDHDKVQDGRLDGHDKDIEKLNEKTDNMPIRGTGDPDSKHPKTPTVDGSNSTAIGSNNNVKGNETTGLGANSNTTGNGNVNIGSNNNVTGMNNTVTGNGTVVEGDGNTTYGTGNTVKGNKNSTFGKDNFVQGNSNISVGNRNEMTGENGINIGNGNKNIGNDSITLGNRTEANGQNSVAIGAGAVAGGHNSVALGANSLAGAANKGPYVYEGGSLKGNDANIAGKNAVGVVSVGSAGQERQITNVGAGRVTADSTDAINGSQLYETNRSVEALVNATDKLQQNSNNVNNNLTELHKKVANNTKLAHEANAMAGAAHATALADPNLRQVAGRSFAGMGAGFNSEGGVAVSAGVNYTSKDDKYSVGGLVNFAHGSSGGVSKNIIGAGVNASMDITDIKLGKNPKENKVEAGGVTNEAKRDEIPVTFSSKNITIDDEKTKSGIVNNKQPKPE